MNIFRNSLSVGLLALLSLNSCKEEEKTAVNEEDETAVYIEQVREESPPINAWRFLMLAAAKPMAPT